VIDPGSIALRLALAAVLGGAVGLERERVESAAGLRTHALVAIGSALLAIVSMFGFRDAVHSPDVVLDPSRVAAQVVSGIGFLGAGVIIFRREIVRGLTTAASVWVVAAIGLAVGGGLILAAVLTTAISLAILAVMKPLERKLNASRRLHRIRVSIDATRTTPQAIVERLRALGLTPVQVDARMTAKPRATRLDIGVRHKSGAAVMNAARELTGSSGVSEVRTALALTNGAALGPPESEAPAGS